MNQEYIFVYRKYMMQTIMLEFLFVVNDIWIDLWSHIILRPARCGSALF